MPRIPFWIFIIIAALYFSATRVDIMDIDATQYAEISREMAQSGDYLHIYDRGNNYLDKPPFLFWVSAASIDIFGATNFGYKLHSILLALLAIFATYRLAKLLYDENTGRAAALILATSQGMFLMTNDIRCDLALMAWVITSIWLIQEWIVAKRWYHLLLAATAMALGMMTKGPIAILAPAFAIGTNFILHRDWRNIFRWQYLLLLLLVAILLIPMSIGLYQQYDLYPSKFIDGKSGVSGLKFFFWTQSFGRITGENVWNNGAYISFQLVNMIWSFLPWIFIFIPALFLNIRNIIRQKLRLQDGQEWLSTGGFLLCYLAVGLSKYQLPHYIFVAFPLASILCAAFLRDCYTLHLYPKLTRILSSIMTGAGFLLFVGLLLILTVVFPAAWYWFVLCAVALSVYFFIVLRKNVSGKIIWTGAAAMILVNIFLSHHFYYELMKYQVGTVVGKFIKDNKIPNSKIMVYRMSDPLNSIHYYANQVVRIKREKGYIPSQATDYVLLTKDGKEELEERGYELQIALQGTLFKVSELTADFINPSNRHKATTDYYFCKITKQGNSLAQ
ncbi:MAG: glycosyltransferase family 39 protein [Chitinophagaceae bacterium]|nr:glycosyltransferase family 39 protein [Chitinophagaceae bacterium]